MNISDYRGETGTVHRFYTRGVQKKTNNGILSSARLTREKRLQAKKGKACSREGTGPKTARNNFEDG